MPQELEEVEEPDEPVEGELEELADDEDLIVDGDVDDDDDVLTVVVDDDPVEDLAITVKGGAGTGKPATTSKVGVGAEEPEEDEDEDEDDEDVEASLDMILKERLVVEEPEVDEDTPEPEDRTDGVERVLPKQPDEFVCRSCFLVKHPNQLADRKKMLCRDCV
jgi:Domain of unknown function (DUF4193)